MSSVNDLRLEMLEIQVGMLQEKLNFLLRQSVKTNIAANGHKPVMKILQEASDKFAASSGARNAAATIVANIPHAPLPEPREAPMEREATREAPRPTSFVNIVKAAAATAPPSMNDLLKTAVEYAPAKLDPPLITIQHARQQRVRMNHKNFLAEIASLAKKDDSGRLLVHGGQIPNFVWPLDCDGNPYEGFVKP